MEGAVSFMASAVSFDVNAAGLHKGCDINVVFDGLYFFLGYFMPAFWVFMPVFWVHFFFSSSYLVG